MATFNFMVDEVLGMLRGYSRIPEQATHLTANVTSTALTFSVNNAKEISRGVAEIDDELVWIDSVDQAAGTFTVAPYGRGFQGSTATAHSANARVTFSPMFPRMRTKQAINDTIQSLHGYIMAEDVHTFPFRAARATYELPPNVQNVIAVEWATTGPSKIWDTARRWRFNARANQTEFASGKSIDILDVITPGRTVQVWYSHSPEPMELESDEFTDTTGLPESCRDVVVIGAAARLLTAVDPSRLNGFSVEANTLDDKLNVGAANNVARYVYALFTQRREEERVRQIRERTIRAHYKR